MNLFMISLLLLLQNHPAESCKSDPDVVSSCFRVHGKLFYANGGPSTRIWIIGTRRILGLPKEDTMMPNELRRMMTGFDDEVFGDFMVCPYTKRKTGRMQMVCIESASNLVHRNRRAGSHQPYQRQ